jgi:hypothetical protein
MPNLLGGADTQIPAAAGVVRNLAAARMIEILL